MNKINAIFKYIQFIAELKFLPDKMQHWLFGTGTRAVEITSALIMLGFAYVLLVSGHEFFIVDPYEKFERLHPQTMAIIMFIVALAQLLAAYYQSARSNVLSGFALIVSALIWFIVFGSFAAAYPPLSTGIFTYLVLSVVCALAGRALITRNREAIVKGH